LKIFLFTGVSGLKNFQKFVPPLPHWRYCHPATTRMVQRRGGARTGGAQPPRPQARKLKQKYI